MPRSPRIPPPVVAPLCAVVLLALALRSTWIVDREAAGDLPEAAPAVGARALERRWVAPVRGSEVVESSPRTGVPAGQESRRGHDEGPVTGAPVEGEPAPRATLAEATPPAPDPAGPDSVIDAGTDDLAGGEQLGEPAIQR